MIRKVKDKGDDKKIIHNANMLGASQINSCNVTFSSYLFNAILFVSIALFCA